MNGFLMATRDSSGTLFFVTKNQFFHLKKRWEVGLAPGETSIPGENHGPLLDL
jgi:hypothetical protein